MELENVNPVYLDYLREKQKLRRLQQDVNNQRDIVSFNEKKVASILSQEKERKIPLNITQDHANVYGTATGLRMSTEKKRETLTRVRLKSHLYSAFKISYETEPDDRVHKLADKITAHVWDNLKVKERQTVTEMLPATKKRKQVDQKDPQMLSLLPPGLLLEEGEVSGDDDGEPPLFRDDDDGESVFRDDD